MNYISQLQNENKELKAKINNTKEAFTTFRAHLHSAKFTGSESDGSRKDWISTGDVLNWLREIDRELFY